MNKLDMESKDIVKDNLEYIRERFPEAVTEENGEFKLNPDSLIQSLSSVIIDDKKEKYELTWPGKKQAIVEGNTRTTKTLRPLKDKSVDFDKTENIYIEGDNLEALKILQESYLNKIKCIYIDPPYNTGNDFIYNDNFDRSTKEELIESGQIDELGNRLVTNNVSNGRFHSDWLSMMYPRLKLARNLLSNDGIIYISINDSEVVNLRRICDEIFNEKNFIAQLVWTNNEGGGSSDSKYYKIKHEYILCYAKQIENLVDFIGLPIEDEDRYKLSDEYVEERGKYQLVKMASASLQYSQSLDYGLEAPDGTEIFPKDNTNKNRAIWRWSKAKVEWGYQNGFLEWKKDSNNVWNLYTKQYINCDKDGNLINRTKKPIGIIDKFSSTQGSNELFKLFGFVPFSYPKHSKLIEYLLERFNISKSDIVLDFFSGSATTAHAVMQLNANDNGNRKFIMIQLPEKCEESSETFKEGYKTICEIGEERIRRAANKIKEETNANIDYGFRVYKIDESNMKDEFYMTPDKISQEQIKLFENNIKDDRTPEDLLTQVILNLGLKLDLPIEEKDMCGNKVFDIDDGELLACFDDNVSIDIIEKIAEIKPRQVVFRDSSFATDQDKVNFEERLKRLSAGTKFNVL